MKKIRIKSNTNFDARDYAIEKLKRIGFSVGKIDNEFPIGFSFSIPEIGFWSDLSEKEIKLLHGKITSNTKFMYDCIIEIDDEYYDLVKMGGTVKAAKEVVKKRKEPPFPVGGISKDGPKTNKVIINTGRLPEEMVSLNLNDAQKVPKSLEILMRIREKVLEIEIDGMVRTQYFLDAIDEEIEKL